MAAISAVSVVLAVIYLVTWHARTQTKRSHYIGRYIQASSSSLKDSNCKDLQTQIQVDNDHKLSW